MLTFRGLTGTLNKVISVEGLAEYMVQSRHPIHVLKIIIINEKCKNYALVNGSHKTHPFKKSIFHI